MVKIPLAELAAKHGLRIPVHQQEDWAKMLQALEETVQEVSAMDDYLPPLDLQRYPRIDVHVPDDTVNGGWALKDNIGLAGVPCTNGSAALPGWIPQFDATVATRIMDAGAVITGKSACENGCYESTSETAISGVVDNPRAKGYSAGGSSSGSAALVAAGAVDMAIGCDQGGSIRMPASFCGIVGLKPTWGLVPYTGIIGLDMSIDHVGPMAQDVHGCALLLECIAGTDSLDDRQQSSLIHGQTNYMSDLEACLCRDDDPSHLLHGVKVGILKEGFELACSDPNVDTSIISAAQRFRNLGATVEMCSMPLHSSVQMIWSTSTFMGSYRQAANGDLSGRKILYMTDRIGRSQVDQELFDASGPGARNMLLSGMYLYGRYGPALYAKCKNLSRKLSDEYDQLLIRFDVLITPTTPFAAPRHATKDQGPAERLQQALGLTFNTSPFDATGHPAISIPVGFVPAKDNSSIKLPVGMQIVGPKFGESLLFRVAGSWEKCYDWTNSGRLERETKL